MSEKDAFSGLVSKIVASEMPEDEEMWSISKEYIVSELFKGRDVTNTRAGSGDYNFITGAEVHTALEVLNVVIATFKIFKMLGGLLQSKSEIDESQIAAIWSKRMEEAGVSPEVASKISKDFSAELKAYSARA